MWCTCRVVVLPIETYCCFAVLVGVAVVVAEAPVWGMGRPVTHCLHVISFRQKLPSYKLSYERKPLRFVIGCCCCCCCCYCVRVFLINCTLVSSTLKTITSFIYRPMQAEAKKYTSLLANSRGLGLSIMPGLCRFILSEIISKHWKRKKMYPPVNAQ